MCLNVALLLVSLATGNFLAPAGSLPSTGSSEAKTKVWTNADLERLRERGLIAIIGQIPEETTETAEAAPYVQAKDPQWYVAQAAGLQSHLESRQSELQRYRQTLEDVRDLRLSEGGINLAREDIGITPAASVFVTSCPESAIEILESRVRKTQHEPDELQDRTPSWAQKPTILSSRLHP